MRLWADSEKVHSLAAVLAPACCDRSSPAELSSLLFIQVQEAQQRNEPIRVRLPDGGEKQGIQGVTTPLDIANSLSKSLAKKVVVADVDGGKWDLFRPLERDCELHLHTFDNVKGKDVSTDGHLQPARAEAVQCGVWLSRVWHLAGHLCF